MQIHYWLGSNKNTGFSARIKRQKRKSLYRKKFIPNTVRSQKLANLSLDDFSRFLRKKNPGNPHRRPENMPGAYSMRVARVWKIQHGKMYEFPYVFYVLADFPWENQSTAAFPENAVTDLKLSE